MAVGGIKIMDIKLRNLDIQVEALETHLLEAKQELLVSPVSC